MPEFVLNRKYNLMGLGHNIRFEKGIPTYVPPALAKAAIGIGAECANGEVDMADEEIDEPKQYTDDEKVELFEAQFKKLVLLNDRESFDAAGIPGYEALRAVMPFTFTRKERNTAWRAYIDKQAE